jgi:hypothetical protein
LSNASDADARLPVHRADAIVDAPVAVRTLRRGRDVLHEPLRLALLQDAVRGDVAPHLAQLEQREVDRVVGDRLEAGRDPSFVVGIDAS